MRRGGNDYEHTCTTQGGSCRLCPGCEPMRLTVTSKSASMPKILTCSYCDGPELAGNIQRGPMAA